MKLVSAAMMMIMALVAVPSVSAATCGIPITIPPLTTPFVNGSIAPRLVNQGTWSHYVFKTDSDHTCLQGELYTNGTQDVDLFVCGDAECITTDACPFGKNISLTKGAVTRFEFLDSDSTVKAGGFSYLNIKVVRAKDDEDPFLFFDALWQYPCPASASPSATPETRTRSRGVSSGLAAFLFFLGAGLGGALLFGAQYIINRRKGQGQGFVAM
jgi:hypothetical protein